MNQQSKKGESKFESHCQIGQEMVSEEEVIQRKRRLSTWASEAPAEIRWMIHRVQQCQKQSSGQKENSEMNHGQWMRGSEEEKDGSDVNKEKLDMLLQAQILCTTPV